MISEQEEIELIEALRTINDKIAGKVDDRYSLVVTYSTNGFYGEIKWLGQIIWDSNEDDRNFEDNDEYESWEDYLSRTMNNWVKKFNKLKI